MTLPEAYAAQPPGTASFFGIVTHAIGGKSTALFRWRNYLTGESGAITSAAPERMLEVAAALLDEMVKLRTPRRRPSRAPVPLPQRRRA